MFGKKKKKQNENNKLFEDLCLLLLKEYSLKELDGEEMVSVCETAEQMAYIIRNGELIKPNREEEEKDKRMEDGPIM